MLNKNELRDRIFAPLSSEDYNAFVVEIFYFQYLHNPIYKQFVDALHIVSGEVRSINQIPFLPVEFFKNHRIISGDHEAEVVFTSTGTTGSQLSHHYVCDRSIYDESLLRCFERFYGDIGNYAILALLPYYLERTGSSLVYMVDFLIKKTGDPSSGFYLNETDRLVRNLEVLSEKRQKVILFGVSFALLDLVAKYKINFPELIVIETGGMKGRQKELVREELHTRLCNGFGSRVIHSEYGMTELLSQAYSTGHGFFLCPPWMKVLIRDVNDPLTLIGHKRVGGINVIDPANIYSCSFLATQDLGITHDDGTFEVLGRFDASDIRGCNLMIA
jgi:phenylacetate-coenzyme A ligase PaaK-like adenylate-forming protein